MRITEILVESELQEGPLLNKIGTGLGKVAGGAAKAVGAVAGGIAGIGGALKKGFAAGKSTVAGGGDTVAPAAGGTASAAKSAAGGTAPAAGGTAPAAPAANVAPPTGTPATASAPAGAAPAAKPAVGATPATAQAKPGTKVAAGAPAAPNPKAASAYSAAQKAVQSLAPEQKKEIVTMLQADPKVKAAATAKPAAKPAAGGAMGAMAQQLGAAKPAAAPANTMANAPVSKTNVAKPGNPNAAPTGNYDPNTGQPISDKGKADVADMAAYKASPKGKEMSAWNDAVDAAEAAGQKPPTLAQFKSSQTAQAPAGEVPAKKTKVASRVPKKAAPSQAELDADREARMGVTSDSVIRNGRMMAEGFSLFRK